MTNSTVAADELRALIYWLSTFSTKTIKNAVENHQIDLDNGKPESIENRISQWLDNKDIALCILHVAKEIRHHVDEKDESDDDDTGSTKSDFSAGSSAQNIDASIRKATYFSGANDIWDHVCDTIETVSSRDTKNKILSALLRLAVSMTCRKRDTYIGRITKTIDPDVQATLMTIIENGMAKDNEDGYSSSSCVHSPNSSFASASSTPSLPRSNKFACFNLDYWDDDENHNDEQSSCKDNDGNFSLSTKESLGNKDSMESSPELDYGKQSRVRGRRVAFEDKSAIQSNSPSKRRRSLTQTLHTSQHRSLTMHIEKLKKENMNLKEELERSRRIEEENASKEGERRSKDLKLEAEMIDKENAMKEKYEWQISELKKIAENSEKKDMDLRDAKERISVLEDEVDILTHSKQKLEVFEDQLTKCKKKLVEFNDTKDALKKEEEAHSKALDRCVELENELSALEPLRKQVETYRGRATDAEIKAAEYEDKLKQVNAEKESLVGTNKLLKETSSFHKVETETMRKRLMEDLSQDCLPSEAGGLGAGISELNPVLKEELVRLRNENKVLKTYKKQTSKDFVTDLEDKLEDSCRLVSSFKEKYFTTNANLKDTERKLSDSLLREKRLQKNIDELNTEIGELQNELQKERDNAAVSMKEAARKLKETMENFEKEREKKIYELKQNHKMRIEEERMKANENENQLTDELAKTRKEHEVEMSNLAKDATEKICHAKVEAKREVERVRNECETEVEELKRSTSEERNDLIKKGKEMMSKKKKAYTTKLMKLKEQHHAKEVEFNKHQEETSAQISVYKHKLHVSLGRQRELDTEIEEITSQKKKLEREKIEILEDNERFKRHMGSRLGSSKNLENQLDSLQNEYNQILKENRALKQLRPFGNSLKSISSESNSDASFPGGNNENIRYGSSLVQESGFADMRSEFAAKLSKMSDEKRELVMRNSAAFTDLQKANQRAWKLEEELAKAKSQLTSTKLALQRFEHSQMEDLHHVNNENSFFVVGKAASQTFLSDKKCDVQESTFSFETCLTTAETCLTTASEDDLASTSDATRNVAVNGNSNFSSHVNVNNKSSKGDSFSDPPKKVTSIMSETRLGSTLDGKPECVQS